MTGGDYLVGRIAELERAMAILLDQKTALEARAVKAEQELAELKKPRLVTEESA